MDIKNQRIEELKRIVKPTINVLGDIIMSGFIERYQMDKHYEETTIAGIASFAAGMGSGWTIEVLRRNPDYCVDELDEAMIELSKENREERMNR